MKILLKNATILDNKGSFHFQNLDVFIQDGIIQKIAENIDIEADKVILKDNLHLSKGWFDSSVCFGEPGYEEPAFYAGQLRRIWFGDPVCVDRKAGPWRAADLAAGI